MTENVLTLLPPRARKVAYIIYGLLGLAGVGITAYYGAVPGAGPVPEEVFGGLAVLGALSPAFSVLAASNVKPPTPALGPAEVVVEQPKPRIYPDEGDERDFGIPLH